MVWCSGQTHQQVEYIIGFEDRVKEFTSEYPLFEEIISSDEDHNPEIEDLWSDGCEELAEDCELQPFLMNLGMEYTKCVKNALGGACEEKANQVAEAYEKVIEIERQYYDVICRIMIAAIDVRASIVPESMEAYQEFTRIRKEYNKNLKQISSDPNIMRQYFDNILDRCDDLNEKIYAEYKKQKAERKRSLVKDTLLLFVGALLTFAFGIIAGLIKI